MIKVEDKVLVGSSKVEGTVVQVGEDSFLVAHKIMTDGKSKEIEQWYDLNVVEEVGTEKKVKSSKKSKSKIEDAKVELGVVPEIEKGDSDGE